MLRSALDRSLNTRGLRAAQARTHTHMTTTVTVRGARLTDDSRGQRVIRHANIGRRRQDARRTTKTTKATSGRRPTTTAPMARRQTVRERAPRRRLTHFVKHTNTRAHTHTWHHQTPRVVRKLRCGWGACACDPATSPPMYKSLACESTCFSSGRRDWGAHNNMIANAQHVCVCVCVCMHLLWACVFAHFFAHFNHISIHSTSS